MLYKQVLERRVPGLQPAHFGPVYATYGGFFIVNSFLWRWVLDGSQPDRFDLIGALVALMGVGIIMYWPRRALFPGMCGCRMVK